MIKLSDHNFIDILNINYRTEYDCESWGCDSICRCGSITEESVVYVNTSYISKFVYDQIFDNSLSSNRNLKIESIIGEITEEVNFYTIDRILRINKIFNPNNWEIEVRVGYYGDEIGDVTLNKELSKKIEGELTTAFDILDLSSRINYLLNLEYGYILPELIGAKYQITEINKSDIHFSSEKHFKSVSKKDLDFYNTSNYQSIRGIFIKSNETLRLIDGYHRCYKAGDKLRVIVTIL